MLYDWNLGNTQALVLLSAADGNIRDTNPLCLVSRSAEPQIKDSDPARNRNPPDLPTLRELPCSSIKQGLPA